MIFTFFWWIRFVIKNVLAHFHFHIHSLIVLNIDQLMRAYSDWHSKRKTEMEVVVSVWIRKSKIQMAACEEVAYSRPLFLTIYTVVIIGIVVSSLYVFSAIHYSSAAWSSFPSLSSTPFKPLPLFYACIE